MPPEVELDTPAILATLIILSILVGSAMLWYRSKQASSETTETGLTLKEWPIGWVNFGIFVCILITSIVFAQQIIIGFMGDQIEAADGKLTLPLAIAGIVVTQVPMLLTFYLSRRFYPAHFSGELNTVAMSFIAALKTALPLFIKYLPLVWLASIVWGQLLTLLQHQGIIDELPKQEVITLLSEGGAVLPILIIALGAVFLAPLVEEIIFRGCFYRFLKSQIANPLAQIASGVVFALIHFNVMSFVPLVIVGVILAKIYEASGNIWVPIYFHACFNAFNLLLLFLFSQSSITV